MAEPNEVDQLLDQMLKGKTPEEILGKDGLLKGLIKRLVERALEGELTTHLPGAPCPVQWWMRIPWGFPFPIIMGPPDMWGNPPLADPDRPRA